MLYDDKNIDPNKKRLADEAKRLREAHELAQRQQEKTRLQLQIDNRKRELDRELVDLRAKEIKLAETKRKLEDTKREQFVLKGQVKQKEGGVGYLNDEAKTFDNQVISAESELERLKIKKDSVLAEINRLKKEIAEAESLLSSKNLESQKLEQDYSSLEISSKQRVGDKFKTSKVAEAKKKEIDKINQDILFKARIIEQLERDENLFESEIAKLRRDRESKERELRDLEVKRDAIKSF